MPCPLRRLAGGQRGSPPRPPFISSTSVGAHASASSAMPCSGLERSLSPPWPRHGLPPRRRRCSTPSSRRHLRPSGSCSKPTIPLHSRGHEVRGARPGITSRSTWPPQLRASIMALTATPLDSPCFLFAARPTPPQHPAPPRMAPLTTSASSTSRCPAATARLPACRHDLHAGLPQVAPTTLTRTRVGLIASHDDGKQCLRAPREWRCGHAPLQCPHGGRNGGVSCLAVRAVSPQDIVARARARQWP